VQLLDLRLRDLHLPDFQLSDLPLPDALTERAARVAQVTGRSGAEAAVHLRRAAYAARMAARNQEGESESEEAGRKGR
jgi:hypothetical protein